MAQGARAHLNNAALGSSPERFLQIGIMHTSGRARGLVILHNGAGQFRWISCALRQGDE